MTIGQKIREIRQRKGMTLKEVSEKCGIPSTKLNFYELDNGLPTISTLQKIATGLDCSIFDIIDEPLGREQSRCIHAEKCVFYNKEFVENEGNK